MRIVCSDAHQGHTGRVEPFGASLVPVSEVPERVTAILRALEERKLGARLAPRDAGLSPLLAVHSKRYVDFLAAAWRLWTEAGRQGPVLPNFWRMRMPGMDPGDGIDQLVDYYSGDPGASLVEGSWGAIAASANCAWTAADIVATERGAAFALCRPPGHHAGSDRMRGSCYLNNAAIAAAHLRARGASKVAILDLDYHHGNGTQEIFYDVPDVLTCSLHGDPEFSYPFYSGHRDEVGTGKGEGFNRNIPLPPGTSFEGWSEALRHAVQSVRDFGADALVVPLGVDTYKDEQNPPCLFGLESDDYFKAGEMTAKVGLPTVITMEGGYNLRAVGTNVANFLEGFLTRA